MEVKAENNMEDLWDQILLLEKEKTEKKKVLVDKKNPDNEAHQFYWEEFKKNF
jgi:hypothetical protein